MEDLKCNLRVKLEQLSKEELVDIISDLCNTIIFDRVYILKNIQKCVNQNKQSLLKQNIDVVKKRIGE